MACEAQRACDFYELRGSFQGMLRRVACAACGCPLVGWALPGGSVPMLGPGVLAVVWRLVFSLSLRAQR